MHLSWGAFDVQTNKTSKNNLVGFCEIDLSDIFSSVSWMLSNDAVYFPPGYVIKSASDF